MNRLPRLGICFALLLILPLSVMSQESDSVKRIDALSHSIDNRVERLRDVSLQLEQANSNAKPALIHRRDQRSFQLLEEVTLLASLISALPEANEQRIRVADKLRGDLPPVSDVIFTRLGELDQRIEEQHVQLADLAGVDRVQAKAYLHSMESTKLRYFSAVLDMLESLAAVGLSSDAERSRISAILLGYTETLVGKVEFAAEATREIQRRLKLIPTDAELASALGLVTLNRDTLVGQLGKAVSLMDRLGIDTTDYRTVLVRESAGVSVGLFDLAVIRQMLEEGWKATQGAFVKNSPDIVLKFIVFVAILLVFRMLSRLVRRGVGAAIDRSNSSISTLLRDIMVSASAGTVMMLGILMALSQIGVSLGPALAGLGVAGFIVGFALQDTLGNFAAGGMILIYRPYDVDDLIEVAGVSGLVKKMTLVSTTIATYDNQVLVIPNSKIWGDVIKNVTAQKLRRVDLEFGIAYSDDVEHAERVLKDLVEAHELVLSSPEPMIKLHTLGDSSVNFIVRPWVRTDDYWTVYWDIMREVKMRFDREGISIPFPQRDIHVYEEKS
ncbi:MAG: mechanosensitive ion channel family protein [Halioglobus sp.]